MADGEMKMTYSAIVRDKDNKRIVRVMFERKNGSLSDTAEGLVPDGKIVKSSGFSPDEIKQLESYLWENSQSIMDEAKKISNPLKWL